MLSLQAAWIGVAGEGDRARACWRDLMTRWSEPHRRYHTLDHLTAVLALVGQAPAGDAVHLAAWFHDAVYDPRATDNEERSAALARSALPALGHDPAPVERLVLLTRTHEYDPGDEDAATLCDADLAVRAAPGPVYRDYARAVREEYAHVPDEDFRTGRTAVLGALLARPRLYGRRSDLEDAARGNLRAEIDRLTQG